MFTKIYIERRDDLHVGRRLGVVDARLHLSAQSTKTCPNIDGTPHDS
jgi:hypothetical protein